MKTRLELEGEEVMGNIAIEEAIEEAMEEAMEIREYLNR